MTTDKAIQTFYRNFDRIGKFLVRLLVKELKAQGHNLTGELVSSVIHEVDEILSATEIAIKHNDYGDYLNKGVPRSRIPFSLAKKRRRRSSSANSNKTSKYIEALINWIKIAGFTSGLEKDVRSTAFAIATKHAKFGNPIPYQHLSSRAKSISKNGRRRKWLDWTIKTYAKDLKIKVKDAQKEFLQDYLSASINELVKANKEHLVLIK